MKLFGGPVLYLSVLAGLSFVACGSDDDTTAPPANRDPVVFGISDTTLAVGDTLLVALRGSDPDGDELEWDVVVELTFEELQNGYRPDVSWAEQELTFVPGPGDRPARKFEVRATDPNEAQGSTGFTVTVR